MFLSCYLKLHARTMTDTAVSQEFAKRFLAIDLQNLYDVFVKYVQDHNRPLKTCIVCLCVANPYERLLRMECCKATTLHFSCWFDAPRNLSRTIGNINRKIKSAKRFPLERKCPTCQTPDSCAVEDTMHFQDMSQIYVFCKVCEEKYTSVDWLSHWKTCGGAFIHLCPKRDLEAAYVDVKNTVTSTCCNPHFWQVAQQVTGFLILLLLMCFFIVTLVLHTVDGTTSIKSSD